LKLPRVSEGLGDVYLRRRADLPQVGRHFWIIGRQDCGTIANAWWSLLLHLDGSKSHLRDLCRLITDAEAAKEIAGVWGR
jgi:hypothetical protein